MTPRVFIAGYYGAGNAGDEWILDGLLSGLARRAPGFEARVLSYNPEDTRRQHGVGALGWGDLDGLVEAVRWSSLVVVGGGGLWQDYWGFDPLEILSGRPGGIAGYGTPILLAHLLGRPSALLGLGVGPLQAQASRNAVRDLAALAGVTSVRDRASLEELVACGVPEEHLHLGADLAFLAEASPSPKRYSVDRGEGRPVLAVALRPWPFAGDPDMWEAVVAAALGRWCAAREGQVVFVPLHDSTQPVENDRLVAESVAARVGLPDRVRLVPADWTPAERFAFLGAADAVLGMRYHSVLAALSAGVPCVGLAYDPKVRHLMEETGSGDAALDLDELDAGNLAQTLIERMDRPSKQEHAEALRVRAQAGFDRALELMHAPAQAVVPPLLGEFVLSQSAHLAALEAALRRGFDLTPAYAPRAEGGLAAVDAAAGRLRSAVRELEQARWEIEQARSDRMAAVGRAARAEAAVEALTEQRSILSRSVELLEASVRETKAEAGGLRGKLAASERQLAILRSTKGVRVLNAYWGLRERLRPWALRVAGLTGGLSRLVRRLAERPFRRVLFAVRQGLELPANLPPVYLYTNRSDLFPRYRLRRPLYSRDRRSGVSLVVTMRNEATSAPAWFEAILTQARLPDEVVIVDNGSTDGSGQLLTEFARRASVPTLVLDGGGLSVGACRNLGVNAARFEILAFTDFGCVPEQHWLGRLVIPLEVDDTVCVSAGWYGANRLPRPAHAFASDLLPSYETIQPETFLPATRSLAIRREIWSRVGGFAGWLSFAGEDTLLDLRLKAQKEPWAFVPEAVVHWDPPTTILEFWDKARLWSKGDGESAAFAGSYWSRLIRHAVFSGALIGGACLGVLGLALRVPPVIVLGAAAALLGATGLSALSSEGGSRKAPAPVRLLGQIARTVGFLQGVAARPQVNSRRYAEARRVVLILAAVPWDDTGGGSRAAQLANEFVRRGDLVVFVHRFPKQESVELNISRPLERLIHLPIEHFDWAAFKWEFGPILANRHLLAIVECPDRGFLPILRHWRKAGGKVVYDLIDDWTTSLGAGWFSGAVEEAIVSQAHLLAASAPILVSRLAGLYRREVFLLPNGVNLELFDASKAYARPDDMPRARFIALYVGALWGEWFDWELLGDCARAYPDAAFVMIGDYRGQCSSPEPNMHFLGLKPQSDLPAYLAHADVGFLPWKDSAITQATSPLKVYEYLAMRLPVVAPDLAPLRGVPMVHRFGHSQEFVAAFRTTGRGQDPNSDIAEALSANSWPSRVRQLLLAAGME